MKTLTLIFFVLLLSIFSSNILAQSSLSQTIDEINQEVLTGENAVTSEGFLTQIVSRILPITLSFGGFILVVMLVLGGYTMMTSVGNPQAQEAGKQRITWSIIGFLLLFSAYWLWQIVNAIFGIGGFNFGDPSGDGTLDWRDYPAPPGYSECTEAICLNDADNSRCACRTDDLQCSAGSGSLHCCEGNTSSSACEPIPPVDSDPITWPTDNIPSECVPTARCDSCSGGQACYLNGTTRLCCNPPS